MASLSGRGAAGGGIKPKSDQYVGSASRLLDFFAVLEAGPGFRPLFFCFRPGFHAICITYLIPVCVKAHYRPSWHQYILLGLRRSSSGSNTSSASSTVTIPSRIPSGLTTGTASRLYLAMI